MKAAKTRALNRKHAGTAKHVGTVKHTPSATRRSASAHKQVARRAAATVKAAHLRAFTPGGSWCAAEAVAASLRLTGRRVGTGDVLSLYRHTADSPEAGASLVATLEAAYQWGLAGVRPLAFGVADLDVVVAGDAGVCHGLLVGLDMPEGPHAVTLDATGGAWSWGGLYDLTGEAVVEEAWQVTWP